MGTTKEVTASGSSKKKQLTLDDIKFNEENKVLAMIACIPIVGLVLLFVEEKDNFVRYIAAQYIVLYVIILLGVVIYWIPCLGWIIGLTVALINVVLLIVGLIKGYKGERFDIPVVSSLALTLLNSL